ncbi:MAG: hypothetical protein H7645_02835 [Candidatus Heimdallarchaeota archaeon]|nr:hypothetical protein [Candidatus Heimdallarchaeota archaeon]MCK4769251.1 hypothetical protein [Candidatus Heimdallarchaeota archaeon]MCK5159532.1 hypothetical protein [Candidatus Heimdallarchaeota archaeon]
MVNIFGVISTTFLSIERKIYRSEIRKVAKEVGENPNIAGGHPAKTFMYRDKDHCCKLKKEKQFLRSVIL